jgi:nucleotide-binding universal stress UspA family protein
MTDGGVVHLVHVIPRERLLLDPWISDRDYNDMVRHRFARFRAQLVVPPNVELMQHTCTGSAAKALLDFAEGQHADLIGAGSHGHGFVTRLVVGSVTTALLRAATCCVLVVPPVELPLRAEDQGNGALSVHPDRSQWSAMLADFTRTNAGRRTRLEVDDPDIGAQAQESEYPLLGIAFDPHDDRLEIMLGELGTGKPHLSRGITDVSALDVLTDKSGNDLALRARHGAGQTVLTFVST